MQVQVTLETHKRSLAWQNSARSYQEAKKLISFFFHFFSSINDRLGLTSTPVKRYQASIRQMHEHLVIPYLVTRKEMMEEFCCQVWKEKGNRIGFILEWGSISFCLPHSLFSRTYLNNSETTGEFPFIHTHTDAPHKDKLKLERILFDKGDFKNR